MVSAYTLAHVYKRKSNFVEKSFKKLQKGIDKISSMCYNDIVPRGTAPEGGEGKPLKTHRTGRGLASFDCEGKSYRTVGAM